ncbi:MAG: hypothetical protein KME17_02145 [Cyanosarcina radialis HA8281-LM2]|jgi:hypothetical protein|nr:hypothetical protein [Cyanosarcina radialis HA8281-LM2]
MVDGIMLQNLIPTEQAKAASKIELQEFINIDLDVLGYFAVGHHEPERFLKTVAKQKGDFPPQERVRWSWAVFEGNKFEEVEELTLGATPITQIEIYD